MTEILNTLLNKNTSNIVIGYLIDPPVLPYLDELLTRTLRISEDPDWCYNRYFVSYADRYKHKGMAKIYFTNKHTEEWNVRIIMLYVPD